MPESQDRSIETRSNEANRTDCGAGAASCDFDRSSDRGTGCELFSRGSGLHYQRSVLQYYMQCGHLRIAGTLRVEQEAAVSPGTSQRRVRRAAALRVVVFQGE